MKNDDYLTQSPVDNDKYDPMLEPRFAEPATWPWESTHMNCVELAERGVNAIVEEARRQRCS